MIVRGMWNKGLDKSRRQCFDYNWLHFITAGWWGRMIEFLQVSGGFMLNYSNTQLSSTFQVLCWKGFLISWTRMARKYTYIASISNKLMKLFSIVSPIVSNASHLLKDPSIDFPKVWSRNLGDGWGTLLRSCCGSAGPFWIVSRHVCHKRVMHDVIDNHYLSLFAIFPSKVESFNFILLRDICKGIPDRQTRYLRSDSSASGN